MDETVSSLLINENFGGPGAAYNLVPESDENNKEHLNKFESKIKKIIGAKALKNPESNEVVGFDAKVNYNGGASYDITDEGYNKVPNFGEETPKRFWFADNIVFTSWKYRYNENKQWVRDRMLFEPFTLDIHPIDKDWQNGITPEFGSQHYDLNNSIERIRLYAKKNQAASLTTDLPLSDGKTIKSEDWFRDNTDVVRKAIKGDNTWLKKYFKDNGIARNKQTSYTEFIEGLEEMHLSNVLIF
ncbi:hypothetical protein AUTU_50190 (plasmid) [Aureibacter tunicatorum]|nr:hypothetical protein AUTU_50190 [Aureibacter tunicatorum]